MAVVLPWVAGRLRLRLVEYRRPCEEVELLRADEDEALISDNNVAILRTDFLYTFCIFWWCLFLYIQVSFGFVRPSPNPLVNGLAVIWFEVSCCFSSEWGSAMLVFPFDSYLTRLE